MGDSSPFNDFKGECEDHAAGEQDDVVEAQLQEMAENHLRQLEQKSVCDFTPLDLQHLQEVKAEVGSPQHRRGPIAAGQFRFTREYLRGLSKMARTDFISFLELQEEYDKEDGDSAIEFLLARVVKDPAASSNPELTSLSDAYNRFLENRRTLLGIGQQVERLIAKYPLGRSALMNELSSQLHQVLVQLLEGSCASLFFGETNSGKSLLLNLLTFDGEKILPSSQTPATSAVVVIRNSSEPTPSLLLQKLSREEEVVAAPQVGTAREVLGDLVKRVPGGSTMLEFVDAERKSDPPVPQLALPGVGPNFAPIIVASKVKDAELKQLPELEGQPQYYLALAPFMEAKNRNDPPWDICRLHWPHSDLLRAGCTVVDTPGLGENPFLDSQVRRMLPQAAGVICVINALKAMPDAVRQLIRELRRMQAQTFDSASIFFVLTQLDRVPEKESRASVKQNILDLLAEEMGDCWNSDNFVSANLAAAQHHLMYLGCRSAGHIKLLKKLVHYMQLSFHRLLLRVYKVLSEVLRQVENDVNGVLRLSMGTVEQRKQEIKQIEDALLSAKQREKNGMKTVLRKCKARMDELSQLVIAYLQSDDVVQRIDQFVEAMRLPIDARGGDYYGNEEPAEHIAKLVEAEYLRILTEYVERISIVPQYQKHFVADAVESFGAMISDLQAAEKQMVGQKYVGTSEFEDLDRRTTPGYRFSFDLRFLLAVLSTPVTVPLYLLFHMAACGVATWFERMKDREAVKTNPAEFKKIVLRNLRSRLFLGPKSPRVMAQWLGKHIFNPFEMIPKFSAFLQLRIRHLKFQLAFFTEEHTWARNQRGALLQYKVDLDATGQAAAGFFMTKLRDSWRVNVGDFVPFSEWERKGGGSFSDVYKVRVLEQSFAKFLKDGVPVPSSLCVAIKRIKEPPSSSARGIDWMGFLREEQNFSKLHHANVVQFHGSFMDQDRLHLVMEYTELGSLRNTLHEERKQGKISFSHTVHYAEQVARAMQYMHDRQLMHRDLKLENVLAFSNVGHASSPYTAKLTDFGLSKPALEMSFTVCGTPTHWAPELAASQPYDFSVDVYSYGIVLWELYHASELWPAAQLAAHGNWPQIIEALQSGALRPVISEQVPRPYKDLMTDCWSSVPSHRPSWPVILKRLELARGAQPATAVTIHM